MRKASRVLRILITVIVLSLGLAPANAALADGPTNVSVSAPASVNTGQTFNVNIAVEPGVAIAGVQFNLAFNQALVTVNNVTEGNLLSQGGASTYFSPGTIDNGAGTITGVAGAITTPGQTVAAPGTFAVISLTAGTQAGTSALTLSGVLAGDINGQAVEISIVNGQAVISQTGGGGGDSGGSGGGGGGGGGGGVTSLADFTRSDGEMVSEVIASDDTLSVHLIIPKGTIVKDRNGNKVSSIRIKKSVQSYAVSANSRYASNRYDIQPNGVTFGPSAILVFDYTDADIPDGISEDSLYVALWDPAAQEWIVLGGTADPVEKSVSVPIEHLSIYTLMAYTRPASFEFSDLTLSSRQTIPGEVINISVQVTNTGDYAGEYQVDLAIDDAVVEQETVTIEGLSSRTVSFDITADADGEHIASIGNLSATYYVNELSTPAAFTISDLTVSPAQIDAGDNVNVSLRITNTGDISGVYNAVLRLDNNHIETRSVEVNGGESREVAFIITVEEPGQHMVTVGDLQAMFTVLPAAPTVTVTESSGSQTGISDFRITPNYDEQTGVLTSKSITYRIDGSPSQLAEMGLILKVYYENALIEEIPLSALNSLQTGENYGSLEYMPSDGWESGIYSYQLELYQDDTPVESSAPMEFTVTPEVVATVVSWQILGIIISAGLVLAGIVIIGVVVRRRDMLRARVDTRNPRNGRLR